MSVQAKTTETATPQVEAAIVTPRVQKGPMEGMIIVGGRPQMERVDMPTISFESIQAIMKMNEKN